MIKVITNSLGNGDWIYDSAGNQNITGLKVVKLFASE
jgi:hypothetical protein